MIQDLKKNPPTLTLPPSLRFGNRVAQLVPRWLPLFLNGGREKLAGRLYQADRKTYCRISKPDLQVTKRIDTTPVTNYNSNMMNYKSETLRKNRTFFTKSKILEKVVKRVQDDKKTHTSHYTHLTHVTHSKKAAFTLAEVLITLGIIGIVAAMTIPTLITKYEKKHTAARLADTFGMLANAAGLAQAQYGDVSTWGFQKYYWSEIEGDVTVANSNITTEIVEKYFLPYLKISRNFGYAPLRNTGISEYKFPNGHVYFNSGTSLYSVILQNGVIVYFMMNNGLNEDETARVFSNLLILMDVNGKKGPNMAGRDLFVAQLDAKSNKFRMNGDGYSMTTLMNFCGYDSAERNYRTLYCGALIKANGWKITDDYPIKF